MLGTRWREVALGRAGAHRAMRSWTARVSKQRRKARRVALHGGKKVKGRARHVALDSQGTLLAVHVCAANKADGAR